MTAGPLDLLLLAIMWVVVIALVWLSVRTRQQEVRRARAFRAWELERVGILTSSTFEPYDPNGYRRITYLQKLEGLRSKGPRGWVKARHG